MSQGGHISEQQRTGKNLSSHWSSWRKTLCTKKLLGKSKHYIKWKGSTLILEALRKF